MLLSIVMIVKNEEKILDKTLSSLNPLINKLNSELIILDTGSTDNTISIAKKYTDNLYFEEWNNNFANMRNISISYAKGDWIFVLDADEVLVDCDKLIEFFNTGLYQKYNCASIERVNIIDEDKNEYTIDLTPRIFKNEKGFKYTGAIHEQPNYKGPVYNSIATFKHYGYMFQDTELLNKKLYRNEKILLDEINKNPNNPYINYQLAKNYSVMKCYEEAAFYMEKSKDLYTKLNRIPIFVIEDLAKLYIFTNEYLKCEKLCLDYIRNDPKNIDIYYYLGRSQYSLGKIKESTESYERYIYLLDHYNTSTQANSFESGCVTIGKKNLVKIFILENYYELEEYENVLRYSEKISLDSLSKIYYKVIYSLYKLGKIEEIFKFYNSLDSNIEKNKFINFIEEVINKIKEEDRTVFYKYFSKIENNYGKLNKLRLGYKIDEKEYNKILREEEMYYFADIIYYGLKNNLYLDNIIENISIYKLDMYFNYLVTNNLEIDNMLYDYLDSKLNTLNINNLKKYSTISKALCKSTSLTLEKYKIAFLSYIVYRYNYLQTIYNYKNNEIVSNTIEDREDRFVLEMHNILILKKINPLQFLKHIRCFIQKYPEYNKGMQCLVNDIEKDFNSNLEIEDLKKKYKSLIEKSINVGNYNNALAMVKEYEDIFGIENSYNIKAIISLYLGDSIYSDRLLKLSYINNPFNEDTIYNIAYIKEMNREYDEAVYFYEKLLNICNDENLKEEITLKIDSIKIKK